MSKFVFSEGLTDAGFLLKETTTGMATIVATTTTATIAPTGPVSSFKAPSLGLLFEVSSF